MKTMPVPDLSGIVVLLVEDHVDTRDMFKQVMEGSGATVLAAASGGEALAIVRAQPPSVVVTDIAMPDHDGIWLVAELRKVVGGPRLPVVAMTGRDREGLAERFDVVLMKPVDPFEMCDRIVKVVASAGRAQRRGVAPVGVKLGDLVQSREGVVGEVVDVSRRRLGYVGVRWGPTAGDVLAPTEERVETLLPLPTITGGAAPGVTVDAVRALHSSSVMARSRGRALRGDSQSLCVRAQAMRARAVAARLDRIGAHARSAAIAS